MDRSEQNQVPESLLHKIASFTRNLPNDGLKHMLAPFFLPSEVPYEPTFSSPIEKWVFQHQCTNEEERLCDFITLLQEEVIDLEQLRALSYDGIPSQVRAVVWQLLLGYLPAERKQQAQVIFQKREVYDRLVQEHCAELSNSLEAEPNELERNTLWEQIRVDVIRTFPAGLEEFFEQPIVRQCLCRILYVYSTVHQDGNYWQGLNELPVPFLVTFFSFYAGCSLRELNTVQTEGMELAFTSGSLEADVYWCLCHFVDRLQYTGNYVISKNGNITEKDILQRFETLCYMCDPDLVRTLKGKGIEFIFFAFRWMVCLLTRELPVSTITRLWDSYLAEGEAIVSFHLHASLGFLLNFSESIKKGQTFDEVLVFVQHIPTEHWTEIHAEYLIRAAEQVNKFEKFFHAYAVLVTVHLVLASLLFLTASVKKGRHN